MRRATLTWSLGLRCVTFALAADGALALALAPAAAPAADPAGTIRVADYSANAIDVSFAVTGGHTYYTLILEKEGALVYALIAQQPRRDGAEHIS